MGGGWKTAGATEAGAWGASKAEVAEATAARAEEGRGPPVAQRSLCC